MDEIWRKVLTLEKWLEWLALACDGLEAGPGEIVHWQPPLWLSSSAHASVGRMNRARFAKSIKAEEEILRMQVLLCQGSEIPPGLIRTRYDVAELSELASPKRRRKRKKSEEAREREKIIQNVTRDGFKGRRYCFELDEHGLKTPHVWQAEGCPASYLKAYDVYDDKQRKWRWRHNINTEKSAKSRLE